MSKIAVLVDSGCNIPVSVSKEKGIYTIPLKINYKDRECRDGIDITPKEVYESLKKEIPTTSLPSGQEIIDLFEQIKSDGFSEVICVTISSGLSGTHNIIRLMAEEETDLKIKLIDTKNIAIGSGFVAILASELVESGKNLDEVYDEVMNNIQNTKVFFCVDTLEYLRKGGRIGFVSSLLGTRLNLKPIISCNDDGVYYTVAKIRGKTQAVTKMIELVKNYIKDAKEFNICISHGGSYNQINEFSAQMRQIFSKANNIYETEISPTLGIHTGPGLLGIGIQVIR